MGLEAGGSGSIRSRKPGPVCVLVVSLIWMVGAGRIAWGDEAIRYELKIPDEPLADSLQALALQSGVQIIFFSELTDGLRGPALDGRYTVTDALTALLAGSNLTFRTINPNT